MIRVIAMLLLCLGAQARAADDFKVLRLEQQGWVKSTWGTSENNRRARFYNITAAGRRQLSAETETWARTVSLVSRLLDNES